MAKALSCGYRSRLRGWCSTNKRAKKERDRFLTQLVNVHTGEEFILGASIKKFAQDHGLCDNELWKLVNGKGKLMYRGWCLKKTLDLVHPTLADGN